MRHISAGHRMLHATGWGWAQVVVTVTRQQQMRLRIEPEKLIATLLWQWERKVNGHRSSWLHSISKTDRQTYRERERETQSEEGTVKKRERTSLPQLIERKSNTRMSYPHTHNTSTRACCAAIASWLAYVLGLLILLPGELQYMINIYNIIIYYIIHYICHLKSLTYAERLLRVGLMGSVRDIKYIRILLINNPFLGRLSTSVINNYFVN